MAFVLDCSIAIAWLFEDEADPATDQILEQCPDTAYVPQLWHLEVANVLLQAEKRGRIALKQIPVRLELLSRLPIVTDQQTSTRAFREIMLLAQTHELTSYDAAYLELALRLNLPLATKDKALLRTAKTVNIQTLP